MLLPAPRAGAPLFGIRSRSDPVLLWFCYRSTVRASNR
jgi:hypothetical protein